MRWVTVLALLGLVFAGEDIAKVYKGFRDRQYIVHLPTGYTSSKAYPLVMVLHGCMQTHLIIQKDTDFNRIADTEGFIAVFPFITSYSGMRNQNCWGFWFAAEIQRGGGEVADLAGIVKETADSYSVDMDRVHITGLSSGGAMTMVAATAYPDVFASAAPAAGVGYGETASCVTSSCSLGPTVITAQSMATKTKNQMSTNIRRVPLLVLHSTNDCTVQLVNAQRIRDSWGLVFGINTAQPTNVVTGNTKGKTWKFSSYGDTEGTMIQTHWVDGMSHGWIGGVADTYSFPDGPEWSQLAWNFFKANPKTLGNPELAVTAAVESPRLCISVDGTIKDPKSRATQVLVRLEGSSPVAASQATVNGGVWHFDQCDLTDNTFYSPVAYAVDGTGTAISDDAVGPAVPVGTPAAKPPVVTVKTASVTGQCATLTGTATGQSDLTVYTRLTDGAGPVPTDWMRAQWINTGHFTQSPYCQLEPGIYGADVSVFDQLGQSTNMSFPQFEITRANYDSTVTSNLGDHVAAQRVASYMSCKGFGTCDTLYNDLFNHYGSSAPFAVYRQTGTNIWYELSDNIPN